MIRRDSLKLLSLGIGASGATLWPMSALAGVGDVRAVFDGRFAMARAFASGYFNAYDCQLDAAALWFGSLLPQHRAGMAIVGLTSPADAMILADCARREGLTFTSHTPATEPRDLIAWDIK